MSSPPPGSSGFRSRGQSRNLSRRGNGCGCVAALLMLAVVVGASFWLDTAGVVRNARVRSKAEQVSIGSDADLLRRYELGVEWPDPHAWRSYASLTVDSARFDRLRVGDSVRIRYLECCPIFARLAERSTLTWVREDGPTVLWYLRWVVWLVGGVAAMVLAARVGRLAVLVVAGVWAAAALALERAGAERVGPQTSTGWAHVHEMRTISRALDSRRSNGFGLPAPFHVVSLAYVPARALDTVVAVDAVDSGSVPGLKWGALVPVRFDAADPRHARLAVGTRTYAARNRPVYVLIVAAIMALVTLFAFAATWPSKPRT